MLFISWQRTYRVGVVGKGVNVAPSEIREFSLSNPAMVRVSFERVGLFGLKLNIEVRINMPKLLMRRRKSDPSYSKLCLP